MLWCLCGHLTNMSRQTESEIQIVQFALVYPKQRLLSSLVKAGLRKYSPPFHVNTQRQILWCSGWACPLKWSYCNRLPSAVTTEPSSYHALCRAFSTHLFWSLLTIFICQIANWGSKWWQNIPHVAQIINVLARITDTRDLCHSASPGVWPPKRGLLGLRQ